MAINCSALLQPDTTIFQVSLRVCMCVCACIAERVYWCNHNLRTCLHEYIRNKQQKQLHSTILINVRVCVQDASQAARSADTLQQKQS